MVGRVLRTAADAWPDAELFLSVDDFSAVAEEPTVAHLHAAGRLTPIEARFHIVDSVVAASRITGFPLFITTAANVLMTADALHRPAAEGDKQEADTNVLHRELGGLGK